MKWQEFQNLFKASVRRSAPQFAPARRAWKLSISENAVSTKVSCSYHAPEFFTKIGRNVVAVMKMLLCCDELSFRVEYQEIGVEIFCDAPLARVASSKQRRSFRHPPRDIRKGESAAAGLGPHHGQRQREAGNSCPGRPKAPLAQSFHLGWAGRMIRCHQIDHSVSKALPKFFAILAAANGRRALEERLAVRDVLERKMQILWASFDAERKSI